MSAPATPEDAVQALGKAVAQLAEAVGTLAMALHLDSHVSAGVRVKAMDAQVVAGLARASMRNYEGVPGE